MPSLALLQPTLFPFKIKVCDLYTTVTVNAVLQIHLDHLFYPPGQILFNASVLLPMGLL